MTRLTTEEIEAIRMRAEKATEGPWKKEESRYEGQWNVTSVNEMHDLSACLCRLNDAEFIANARDDIPKLLAEVERLHEDLRKAVSLLSDSHEMLDDDHCYDTDLYGEISKYLYGEDDA